MSIPIRTSHSLLLATGEPPATVRVQNIQSTIQGPSDAWGRQDRPQPISVSVAVGMAQSFGPTSTSDALASDTVHYGLLSKAVLATLARLSGAQGTSSGRQLTLPAILDTIWTDLTGVDMSGQQPASPAQGPPFLKLASVKSLQVGLRLPKATLQGAGVCLTATAAFARGAMTARGIKLALCDLRIPILIGTIEALLADMAVRITAHLVRNHTPPADGEGWQLGIAVEKPIAVVFADAPCVELRINTNDVVPGEDVVPR
ncbi:hypothetical protein VCV18_005734 [Metarhizium anisopliae]